MIEERPFIKLIREICNEKNIDFSLLSYNWICQLKKNGKVVHIVSNKFDLNPEAAGRIACDKGATYTILNSFNIPAVEHEIIFNPLTRSNYVSDDGNISKIASMLDKYKKIVIKITDGNEGKNVFLCSNMKEVEIAIQKLLSTEPSFCVCPFYTIKKEYRTFYLDGNIELIYGKTKPFVVGDGVSNLYALIKKLNLPDRYVVTSNLNDLDMEYIPKKDEKFEISWKYNLSSGATPSLLEKGELYTKIEKLAKKAGEVTNIKFATIDIVDTEENGLMILEINSGVGGTLFIENIENGYEMIKKIYSKAIDKMFE